MEVNSRLRIKLVSFVLLSVFYSQVQEPEGWKDGSTKVNHGSDDSCWVLTRATTNWAAKRRTHAVKSAAAVAALVASVFRVAPQTAPL